MMLIKVDGASSRLTGGFQAAKEALKGGFLTLHRLDSPSQMGRERIYTHMLVDEDGLLKQLEPNHLASIIAGRHIVGDAVLCCEGDID